MGKLSLEWPKLVLTWKVHMWKSKFTLGFPMSSDWSYTKFIWFIMQVHTFQTFSVTSFFHSNLLTSRNYPWHYYLTWWHLAGEILEIKQPLQIVLPSKVVHNFCQGSREGTLEQPGEKKRKQTNCTVYCLVFLADYASFLWFLPSVVKCTLCDTLK